MKFSSYSSTSSFLRAPAHHLFKFYFRLRFMSASTWKMFLGIIWCSATRKMLKIPVSVSIAMRLSKLSARCLLMICTMNAVTLKKTAHIMDTSCLHAFFLLSAPWFTMCHTPDAEALHDKSLLWFLFFMVKLLLQTILCTRINCLALGLSLSHRFKARFMNYLRLVKQDPASQLSQEIMHTGSKWMTRFCTFIFSGFIPTLLYFSNSLTDVN